MQQINLYQFLQKPVRSRLNVKMVIFLCKLFFILLMIYYFYGLVQMHSEKMELNQAVSDLNKSRQHLIELVNKYPQLNLESQLISTNITDKACQIKFSLYLTGLANVNVSGVWLTEFSISNSLQLVLKGHALKESYVQQYLNKLNSLAIFAGKTFKLQELTEAEDKKLLNFSVTSGG